MDLQTEIKRLERLNAYLELIQRCDYSIAVAVQRIEEINEDFFGSIEFYSKRIFKQRALKTWLQNRYKLALKH